MATRPSRRRSPFRRGERGAGLVEYALIVALFVGGTYGAIGAVTSGYGEVMDDVETQVGSPTTPATVAGPSTSTSTTRPPATSIVPTTTTSTSTSTTSTTRPPSTTTTTVATTTTRAPSTTTTTRPPSTTTTTRPPASSTGAVSTGSATIISSTQWRAAATITITNNYGQPVTGATVTVRYRLCTGTSSTTCGAYQTATLPATNSSGQTTGSIDLSRSSYARLDMEVTGVSSGSLTWTNGSEDNISIYRP